MNGLLKSDRRGFSRTFFTWRCTLAAILALYAFNEVQAAPDFSGVWFGFQNSRPSERRWPTEPKLTKEGQAIVDAFRAKYDVQSVEPGAYCVATGMPTMMFGFGNYPIEIIQTPKQITILAELEMQVRRIYLDGRKFPEDYPETRSGYSIGRWEGDTLVVETALLKEWPLPRWPHSDEMRIVERFSLQKTSSLPMLKSDPVHPREPLGEWILVNEMTITDPKMYPEPEKITMYYRRLPDYAMLEYNCPEGLWWEALEKTEKKP